MNGFTDKCHLHPANPAWNCRDCDTAAKPPPDGWRDTTKANLGRRARPARRPKPTPDTDRIDQIRAALDAQEATQ